jgi:hypothetical protein
MEAAWSSETLIPYRNTTLHHRPEDFDLEGFRSFPYSISDICTLLPFQFEHYNHLFQFDVKQPVKVVQCR